MNGVKSLILQDLPRVLPANRFQTGQALHLHTSPTSRRFWSFFEFSRKSQTFRDHRKVPSSKEINPKDCCKDVSKRQEIRERMISFLVKEDSKQRSELSRSAYLAHPSQIQWQSEIRKDLKVQSQCQKHLSEPNKVSKPDLPLPERYKIKLSTSTTESTPVSLTKSSKSTESPKVSLSLAKVPGISSRFIQEHSASEWSSASLNQILPKERLNSTNLRIDGDRVSTASSLSDIKRSAENPANFNDSKIVNSPNPLPPETSEKTKSSSVSDFQLETQNVEATLVRTATALRDGISCGLNVSCSGQSGNSGGSRKSTLYVAACPQNDGCSFSKSHALRESKLRSFSCGATRERKNRECQDAGGNNSVEECHRERRNTGTSRKCAEERETEGRTICTKPRQNDCPPQNRKIEKCGKPRDQNCSYPKRQGKKKAPCKRYCCPQLQHRETCSYDKETRPRNNSGNECENRTRRKSRGRQEDPTCLSKDKGQGSCKRPRETCSAGGTETCERRDRGRTCKQQTQGRRICSDPSRQSQRECRRNETCKRERSRSEQFEDCSQNVRKTCNRRRSSRERRSRSSDRECSRSSSCPGGRRNYSQMKVRERAESSSCILSVASRCGAKTIKNRSYGTNEKCENDEEGFFDKKSPKPSPSCGKSEGRGAKCKSGGLEEEIRKKYKKKGGGPKCPTRTEGRKESCKPSFEREKERKGCGPRPELMTAKGKDKSGKETVEEQLRREKEEIRKCKEASKSKDKPEKKAKPTGLERVISPCKQKQSKQNVCKRPPKKCSDNITVSDDPSLTSPSNLMITESAVPFVTPWRSEEDTLIVRKESETIPRPSFVRSSSNAYTSPTEKFNAEIPIDREEELPLFVEIEEEENGRNPSGDRSPRFDDNSWKRDVQ